MAGGGGGRRGDEPGVRMGPRSFRHCRWCRPGRLPLPPAFQQQVPCYAFVLCSCYARVMLIDGDGSCTAPSCTFHANSFHLSPILARFGHPPPTSHLPPCLVNYSSWLIDWLTCTTWALNTRFICISWHEIINSGRVTGGAIR